MSPPHKRKKKTNKQKDSQYFPNQLLQTFLIPITWKSVVILDITER